MREEKLEGREKRNQRDRGGKEERKWLGWGKGSVTING